MGEKGDLKAMEAYNGGSLLESGPTTTPLPDKTLLVSILEKLKKSDAYDHFSVPVDPNKFPKYYASVKQPMDFGTIRWKLDAGLYSSLEELKADVNLICSNAALVFSDPNVFFWQANYISDLAKSLFESLIQDEKVKKEVEEEEYKEYELCLKELVVEQAEAELKKALREKNDDDDDDDDDDVDIDDHFGEAEKMASPKAVKRIVDGNTIHEIAVPVIKDDKKIKRSMYRDDILPTDTKRYFAEKLELSKELFCHVPSECSICLSAWNLTSGEKHQASALPCGHVFGRSCIEKWLQLSSNDRKCPKCNLVCLLEDVRPLRITTVRIPPVDEKISARRFPLTELGFLKFHKHETGRRNFALLQWSRSRMRLTEVLRRLKVCSKLVDGSLQQAEAETWKVEAEAWKVKAQALSRRAERYNQRVNAYLPRLKYFASCLDNIC